MHDQVHQGEGVDREEGIVFRRRPGRERLFFLFYQAATRILAGEKEKTS